MMLTNKYKRVPLDQIKVARESRHRSVVDTGGLKDSISRIGVMNPIIVDKDMNLLAGERRFQASCELGLPDIPVRFIEDIPELERQIIELEENLRRKDLPWTDTAKALVRIHQLYKEVNGPKWSQLDTASALHISPQHFGEYMVVGQELEKGNPRVVTATSLTQAANTLERDKQRRDAAVMEKLLEDIAPEVAPNPESIQTGDFIKWAAQYAGQTFNFIHCDFPYGVNLHESAQGRSEQWGAYHDTPDTYWELLTALASYQNNIVSSSAHMMFWFSMQFYCETLHFFRTQMPEWEVNKFPLVWDKTDNKGILPDPKRGPRRTYETAFLLTRGDRFIVKAVKNSYGCPSTKLIHQSEKPEPMLRHFFTMFIDDTSRVLDPTCGSGTALRAAESLGATFVFGLERNEDYARAAREELRKFRTLRVAAR